MEQKKRNCILHIGAPKTGTTALQKFLSVNREALARYGWTYPDVSLRGFGHHDLAFLVSGGYPEWAIPQERSYEALLNELINSVVDKDRIIISSENFYLLPNPQGIAQMLQQASFPATSVTVVVYLRRQDDAHISYYNQMVKAQGYEGTISESIAETHDLWDYAVRLDEWAKIFGHENLVIRPYQQEDLEGGDVCRDFLKISGLPPRGFDWPKETINTRINTDILEFQRLINRLPFSPLEKRRFFKELIALTSATDGMNLFEDRPLLTSAQRREILYSYAEGNARIAQKYLGRNKLFNEDFPIDPPPTEMKNGLTIEKLTSILGWILVKRFGT